MKNSLLLTLFAAASAFGIINTSITIDATAPGPVVNRQLMTGTCVPIWNNPQLYQEIKTGMQTAQISLMRFPNGSLSNDYHWNGQGAFDGDKKWVCDSVSYLPGFQSESAYRGTSKSNYGFIGTSNITDGDTNTMWWSDPAITERPTFFYLELPQVQKVDSIMIMWGDKPAVDFDIDCWSAVNAPYPGPHTYFANLWSTTDSVTGNTAHVYKKRLTYGSSIKYLRVAISKTRGDSGAQVREVYLYRNDSVVTVNKKMYGATSGNQTRVMAVGTHPGNTRKSGTTAWDFETFINYVSTIGYAAQPTICVNYGLGTAAEAAAWVHYANIVKHYGIKYWQVGNEMDGDWEEAGPVTARMYAERFVAYSKAMKKVDPSILVFGPVASGAAFEVKGSGEFDNKAWMESFVSYVGDLEKLDNTKYLDGIDFHSYPYWSAAPQLYAMMPKADYVNDRLDSLKNWIARYLVTPDSTRVFMSEYNSSVSMSNLIQLPANGVFCATMFAGLAEKFSNRAMAVIWDSFEGGEVGPDNTWGSLSLFNTLPGSQYSSFSKAPSAAYWGLFTAANVWLSPKEPCSVVKSTYTRADGVRVFSVKTSSDLRVFILNEGFDTAAITPTITGGNFAQADIFSWSEREFAWIGNSRTALAYPNCGPTSTTVSTASITTIKVPQLSMVVIRYHNGTPAFSDDRFIHLGLKNTIIRMPDSLVLYGTGASSSPRVKSVGWSIDTKINFTAAQPLDGAFDGPMEGFRAASILQGIASGTHLLYVRMVDSAQTVVIDSIPFFVTGQLRPVVMIDNFEDGDFKNMLPDFGLWYKHAAGANETSVTPVIETITNRSKVYQAPFTIVQPPSLGYDCYVSMATRIDTSYMRRNSGWFQGITFSYASTHAGPTGAFSISMLTSKVRDYADYTVALENTGGAWRTVSLSWSDFKQPSSWGVPKGPLQTQDISGIEIRAIRTGTGTFMFDNILFLGDSGVEITRANRPAHEIFSGTGGLTWQKRAGGFLFGWKALGARLSQKVAVYDSQGSLVHLSGELSAAATTYSWNGKTTAGRMAGAGLYLITVKQGAETRSQSFITVR